MLYDPEFSWFLPTAGDLESFGNPETQRTASFEYLLEVARAAERSGFVSVLIPVGDACEDAWVVGGMVAARTEKLKMLVAVRPGFVAPVVAAKMVATFDKSMLETGPTGRAATRFSSPLVCRRLDNSTGQSTSSRGVRR